VLDALRELDLERDTIVAYLGDNGYALGHRGRFEKHTLYEESVRVPFIVSWPGRAEPRRVDDLVGLIDLAPTLLDLMGLAVPEGVQGRSVAGLVRGEPDASGRDYVFSEYLENEEAMVRSDRYKLIVGTGARERQDGYRTGRPLPGPYERLYDLTTDPGETVNLIGRPEFASIEADLRHELHRVLTTTRRDDDRVPEGLPDIEAIRWCLVPRDEAAGGGG
jgi:choline-sulfatase